MADHPCTAAINGNTDTEYVPGNCIATGWGRPPGQDRYWLLDLGREHTIHQITVYGYQHGEYFLAAVLTAGR